MLVLGGLDAVLPGAELLVACAGAGIGAVAGGAIAASARAVVRTPAPAASLRSVEAARYEVVANPAIARLARLVLGELAARTS